MVGGVGKAEEGSLRARLALPPAAPPPPTYTVNIKIIVGKG